MNEQQNIFSVAVSAYRDYDHATVINTCAVSAHSKKEAEELAMSWAMSRWSNSDHYGYSVIVTELDPAWILRQLDREWVLDRLL
jgi:hypothetical protein